jgi:hypothetical protein
MSPSPEPSVPALWPAWSSPRRIALGGLILLFADMVVSITPALLPLAGEALRQLFSLESLRALAAMGLPAVTLGLLCAWPAMHGRSALRAALGCLGAGLVFGVVTYVGGYATLMSMSPRSHGGGGPDMMMGMILPGQVLAFTLSLLGLALPISRSHRTPSCDAVHEALIVTGTWLLAAGTLVRWNGFGLTMAAWARVTPSTWSLPCVLAGLTLLVTGLRADHRLLTWLSAVRRGEEPGWRIEPLADRDVEVPAVLVSRATVELEGLLVVDRDGGSLPVARVFLEGSDRRRLVGARVRAAVVAVVLLVAVLPAALMGLWSQMRG